MTWLTKMGHFITCGTMGCKYLGHKRQLFLFAYQKIWWGMKQSSHLQHLNNGQVHQNRRWNIPSNWPSETPTHIKLLIVIFEKFYCLQDSFLLFRQDNTLSLHCFTAGHIRCWLLPSLHRLKNNSGGNCMGVSDIVIPSTIVWIY